VTSGSSRGRLHRHPAQADELNNAARDRQVADESTTWANRRVRAVGELLQNQFRMGLIRMERIIKERMTISDPTTVTSASLINARPVVAANQGVLRLQPALPVHGPGQPPG